MSFVDVFSGSDKIVRAPSGPLSPASVCSQCGGSGKVGVFGYVGAGLMTWPCEACTDFPDADGKSGVGGAVADDSAVPGSDAVDQWSIFEHDGFQYATLCREWSTTAQDAGRDRQQEHLALPAGWELAPEDEEKLRVVARHPWGCEALVVATGSQYQTLCKDALVKCGDGSLETDSSGARYRPTQRPFSCPRVLICRRLTEAAVAGGGVEPKRMSSRVIADANDDASRGRCLSDIEMCEPFSAGN